MNLRDRFQRFMYGRYGMDEFGRFLNIAALVMLVLSMIAAFFSQVANVIISVLAILMIIYSYFRMFSKNYAARERENRWYCDIRYRKQGGYSGRPYGGYGNPYQNNYGNTYQQYTQQPLTNEQKKALDRKTHRIFKCPNCAQKIRVPKHRGKICIKCPSCRIEFVRKT